MNYIEWWWRTFWFDFRPDTYKPHASALCKIMMPCLPEWKESFQHAAGNDNRKM